MFTVNKHDRGVEAGVAVETGRYTVLEVSVSSCVNKADIFITLTAHSAQVEEPRALYLATTDPSAAQY